MRHQPDARGQAAPLVAAVMAVGLAFVVALGHLGVRVADAARARTAADAAAAAGAAAGRDAASAMAAGNGAVLVAYGDADGTVIVTVRVRTATATARAALLADDRPDMGDSPWSPVTSAPRIRPVQWR